MSTLERTSAQEYTVVDRRQVKVTIHLQGRLTERKIPVKVIWPDGSVAQVANVWLAEQSEPSRIVGGSVSHTAADGTYTLVGFEGIAYILRANLYQQPKYTPYCAERQIVNAGDSLAEPIVLTLSATGDQCRGSY